MRRCSRAIRARRLPRHGHRPRAWRRIDVDIRSAHPWAYPYNDIAVVHNGQITNYWIMRREMERLGHRFMSNCDLELLAVYTANNLEGQRWIR